MSTATKLEIDKRVSILLGLNVRHVAAITQAFIDETRRVLVAEGQVVLPHLGRIKVHVYTRSGVAKLAKGYFKPETEADVQSVRLGRTIKVHFAKSPQLKGELEKHYGKVWRR